MDSVAGVRFVQNIKNAFQVIAILQVLSYLWPKQATVLDGDIFDYIVVGAGSAGCVIAARLAENRNTSVLLIEAGGDPALETTIPTLMIYLEKGYMNWNYFTERDSYALKCHQNQVTDLMLGKLLGGSGGINFLLYAEGHYKDYDNWAKIVGNPNWSWKKVAPYFAKAFTLEQSLNNNYLGYNGSQGVLGLTKADAEDLQYYLDAFQEAGNKLIPFLNATNTIGYAPSLFTIANGVRQSSANYLTPIKDYDNLYVLKNTTAKKILFDNHKNAVGVEIVTRDGTTMSVKARKEVIVSCGVINSPKLLMLSGIGPKRHLESKGIRVISNLPVGKNFHDHLATIVIHNLTKIPGPTSPGDSREYPAHVVSGCVNLDKTKKHPDYCTINYSNVPFHLIQFCTFTYGICCEICNAMFAFPNTNRMLFSVVTNIQPKSRGEILLRSANYTDAPIVKAGYFSDKRDVDSQVKYIKDFLRVTNTTSFQRIGAKFVNPKLARCVKYPFGSAKYWRCYALCMTTSRRHFAGTNAMGLVVDSKLRVKGVKGLRVADASIMPVITSGDTFGPTVVIGEIAADIIKKDNGIPRS